MRYVRHPSHTNVFRSAAAFVLFGLGLACDPGTNTVQFSDTEQRRFEASCSKAEKACKYRRVSGRAASDNKSELQLSAAGRMVGVCDVEPGKTPEPGDCRAIVCEADNDCPPSHGLPTGHCLNGLCISPENELGPPDAIMLCLAGTGLGRNAPKQVARFAMALNCGIPCKIPGPCRQP